MPAAKDITNQRFGRLTAKAPTDQRSAGKIVWECACDCGSIAYAAINHLMDGRRVSCGCAKAAGSQRIPPKPKKHGHWIDGRASPTYYSWSSMRTRCSNPNAPDYSRYGGRGIAICERWDSFDNFLEDMGERPEGKTLDRIDVNGNYEPSNCRWATYKEQAANTRRTRLFEAFGEIKTFSQWARDLHICKKTLNARLEKGMTFEEALLCST